MPDFLVRVANPELNVVLETKGFDHLEGIKVQAAKRWVDAVNADGQFGRWAYVIAKKPEDVKRILSDA